MKRVTVAWFSWDWSKLLGHRAVNLSDDVLASGDATHRFIVGLGRSVMADLHRGEKQHVHAALAEGELTAADLVASIEQLKEAHAARNVRFLESTENW